MARIYKSPGVYIEEKPSLPAAITPLETAVPAFIGYTQKEAYKLQLKEITSQMEFEQHFCGADQKEITDNAAGPAPADAFLEKELYSHMKLYFANGGGRCYIISLGRKTKDSQRLKDDYLKGLAILAIEDEPTLIVMPEAAELYFPECMEVYRAALAQAAQKINRFVIMDVPEGLNAVRAFREGIGNKDLSYGAAYYPYLRIEVVQKDGFINDKTSFNSRLKEEKGFKIWHTTKHDQNDSPGRRSVKITLPLTLAVPPSAAIAGIYCHTDQTQGVWKAPANVSVQGVMKLDRELSQQELEDLVASRNSGKLINPIRTFPGKGILVWGARTLEEPGSEWRYLSVKRFCGFVEKSIKNALAGFAFESNEASTWSRATAMTENFLTVLWRKGALAGIKPEDAFFVQAGLGSTMTSVDVSNGKMIVTVGLAVVRPAEFIILRFSQKMNTGR